jgi:hypothetical protein
MSAVALAAAILYFVNYSDAPDSPAGAGAAEALLVAGQFLSMSFGPVAADAWPLGGVIAVALYAATAWRLAREWNERPGDRPRVAALALFLLAMLATAAGVGIGRSGYNPARGDVGLLNRYALSAVPALFAAYLAWAAVPMTPLSRAIQTALFLVMVLQLPHNTRIGLGAGNCVRELEGALVADIDAGLSPREVAARHWPHFYGSEGKMAERLEIMRDFRFGPYRNSAGGK